MFINQVLAHAEEATNTMSNCPMCQWMMGGGGPVWGGIMMLSMALFWILLLAIMVLLVVWLVKQIKK